MFDETEIVLPLESRTATTRSRETSRDGCTGLIILVDATVVAAAETINVGVEIYSPYSQSWVSYVSMPTPISAAGVYAIILGPAGLNSGTANVTGRNVGIPSIFRVVATHSSTGAHTYGIELQKVDAF